VSFLGKQESTPLVLPKSPSSHGASPCTTRNSIFPKKPLDSQDSISPGFTSLSRPLDGQGKGELVPSAKRLRSQRLFRNSFFNRMYHHPAAPRGGQNPIKRQFDKANRLAKEGGPSSVIHFGTASQTFWKVRWAYLNRQKTRCFKAPHTATASHRGKNKQRVTGRSG